MECWKSAYVPWKIVTVLKGWSMVCCLSMRIIVPIFFSEMIRTGCYQELIMNFIPFLEAYEQDCWFQEEGLWCIHRIQQCRCWVGSLMVIWFLENCGPPQSLDLLPLDFYCQSFFKENFYKNYLYTLGELKQNTEPCILNITAEILHVIRKERYECTCHQMQWTLPAFNVTLFLFSGFSVIYFLTTRTCVKNGLCDFLIVR
jgi:hypothetical protein